MCSHSTGRGGLANITSLQTPPNEVHPHIEAPYEYMGRGGAGNLQPGSVYDAENAGLLDEVERLRINHEDGV